MPMPVFRDEIIGDIDGDYEPRYNMSPQGHLELLNAIMQTGTPQNAGTMNNLINIDNPDSFPNCVKTVSFPDGKMVTEWRDIENEALIVRREMDFSAMTRITILYADDGVTEVQRRTVKTTFPDNGIIQEVSAT